MNLGMRSIRRARSIYKVEKRAQGPHSGSRPPMSRYHLRGMRETDGSRTTVAAAVCRRPAVSRALDPAIPDLGDAFSAPVVTPVRCLLLKGSRAGDATGLPCQPQGASVETGTRIEQGAWLPGRVQWILSEVRGMRRRAIEPDRVAVGAQECRRAHERGIGVEYADDEADWGTAPAGDGEPPLVAAAGNIGISVPATAWPL